MSLLGNELKRLRELRGYTLEEASKQIHITRQYLSMLEKGQRRSASFEIMNRIAEIYGVPLDYLKKFTSDNAKELNENEIKIWLQLNKRVEDEVYYKNSNSLLNAMMDIKESM